MDFSLYKELIKLKQSENMYKMQKQRQRLHSNFFFLAILYMLLLFLKDTYLNMFITSEYIKNHVCFQ